MYHDWLDRWDEQRAARGDAVKVTSDMALNSKTPFPQANEATSIEDLGDLADLANADPTFFDLPHEDDPTFNRTEQWLKFPSSLSTATEANNTVWSKITEGRARGRALIVFHHWNATKRNQTLAGFFAKQGITVIEIALPYHLERSRHGASHASDMLSPDVGRTLHSVRQAVLDGRKLIKWLKAEGYDDIAVLGMSLGSWVAGLVAAHDTAVSKAALFLTAGSLADMVWTGRATRHIRASLAPKIDVVDLRRAWGPISLENHITKLTRPNLAIQIVLGNRDTVVWPELSRQFIDALTAAGASPNVLKLNCGHYSLALPPYIIRAGLSVRKLLKHR